VLGPFQTLQTAISQCRELMTACGLDAMQMNSFNNISLICERCVN